MRDTWVGSSGRVIVSDRGRDGGKVLVGHPSHEGGGFIALSATITHLNAFRCFVLCRWFCFRSGRFRGSLCVFLLLPFFFLRLSWSSFGRNGATSRREAAALQRAMELAMGVEPKGGDVSHRRVTGTLLTDEVRVNLSEIYAVVYLVPVYNTRLFFQAKMTRTKDAASPVFFGHAQASFMFKTYAALA